MCIGSINFNDGYNMHKNVEITITIIIVCLLEYEKKLL